METSHILVEVDSGVATISINRPEARNSMDKATRAAFLHTLKEAEADIHVRVLIIRGRDGHFSAGGSIQDLREPFDVFVGRDYCLPAIEIVKTIFTMDKPVIAAVDGYAVGAGCSLVLACDLAYATDRAKFSQIFIKVGLSPDYGSCYFLPRVVGLKKAKELAFTGRMIDAREAETFGMINKVIPPDQLDDEVRLVAQSLATGPTKALELTKRLLNRSWELDLNTMIEFELMATAMCFQTEDHRECVRAFLDKRSPEFRGK